MTTIFFALVSKTGVVELRKTPPHVPPAHRAVKIELRIPDEAFDPMPAIAASIDVPAEAVYRPISDVEAEVMTQ